MELPRPCNFVVRSWEGSTCTYLHPRLRSVVSIQSVFLCIHPVLRGDSQTSIASTRTSRHIPSSSSYGSSIYYYQRHQEDRRSCGVRGIVVFDRSSTGYEKQRG